MRRKVYRTPLFLGGVRGAFNHNLLVIMKKVLVMLAMVAAVSGNAFAQSSTYQVRLEQMHCGGCSGRVKQALASIDAVQ